MSTLTEEIATYLEDNGFGEVGVDIFVMPDAPPKPDRMIMVTRTGSWDPDARRVQRRGLPLTSPTFQVIVRGGRGDGNWCENEAERINNFLGLVANTRMIGSEYIFINHLSGPSMIGMDEVMRPIASINFAALGTIHTDDLYLDEVIVYQFVYVYASLCKKYLISSAPTQGNGIGRAFLSD